MDTLFRRLTLALCDGAPLEDGLCAALHLLRAALPVSRLLLLSSAGDGSDARLVAESDAASGRLLDLPLSAAEGRAWAMQVTAEAPLLLDAPAEHPLLRTIAGQVAGLEQSAAWLCPIGVGHRAVGALLLWGADPQGAPTKLLHELREPFAIALEQWLQRARLLSQRQHLIEDRRALEQALWGDPEPIIIGERVGLRSVMEQVRRVASTTLPVLLLGEPGVGKKLLARVLHHRALRPEGPLVRFACAQPAEPLERALFGDATQRGAIERAEGGTLFLQDLDALPLVAQERLLRFLQQGALDSRRAEVRVIAGTHQDLRRMVAAGRFHEELWFRLNTAAIVIPPLRERAEDIPALVDLLVRVRAAARRLEAPLALAPGALARLQRHRWPGNVRELEVLIERALFLYEGGPLQLEPSPNASEAPPKERPPAPLETPAHTSLDDAMAAHIQAVLASTHGKIHGPGGAAEILGLKATTLRNRMDKLKIPYLKHKS